MIKNLEVNKKKIETILKNKNIILVCLILGIFLMVFPKFSNNQSSKSQVQKNNSQDFVEKIQNDLSKMISNVEGAGKSKVLITIEEGEETVYATEKKQNSQTITDEKSYDSDQNLRKRIDDFEKKYITTKDSNGNENPLVVKKIEPKIRGAVISCQGAKNKIVRENIIKLVSVALDISPKKICVTKFRN